MHLYDGGVPLLSSATRWAVAGLDESIRGHG
jgi:hypothetical protein